MGQARFASFTPVLLKQDVSKELALTIEERRPRLSGIFIQIRPIRTYPKGEVAAHVVGYIGKISREEYEALQTLKKIQDFSPTQSQKKALRCAERNFLRGTTLSYHELSKQLGFTH